MTEESDDKSSRFQDKIRNARRQSLQGKGTKVRRSISGSSDDGQPPPSSGTKNRRKSESMASNMKHMDPDKIIQMLEQMAINDDEACVQTLHDMKNAEPKHHHNGRRSSKRSSHKAPTEAVPAS